MREQVDAPVEMRIRYEVKRMTDGQFSYQVVMDFWFTNQPTENIKDEILVEFGVYNFERMNEANIQGKRISNEFKAHFAKELTDLIIRVVENEGC